MKSRTSFFFVLMGLLVVSLAWQAIPVQQSEIAQAQTAQDPRIVRPGETPITTINRIISEVYSNASSNQGSSSAEYALPFIPINNNSSYSVKPTQMDMNADGLTDLVYSGSQEYGDNYNLLGYAYTAIQYVMLNTGNGYKMSYACKIEVLAGGTTTLGPRQGDCAL